MSGIPPSILKAATQEAEANRVDRRRAILEGEVERGAIGWLSAARDGTSGSQLRVALGQNDPRKAVEDLVGDAMEDGSDRIDLAEVADSAAGDALRDAARAAGVPARSIDRASVRTRAARWAAEYTPALAGEVTDQTKRAVGDRVAAGLRQGQSKAMIANRVKEVIGLTEQGAKAVERVREQALIDGETQTQADDRAARLTDQKLKIRARTIAQTETVRADEAGRNALWEEMVDSGLVDPDKVTRIWVTREDDDVDKDICRPLQDHEAKMNEPFQPGGFMAPPTHPNCRCSLAFEAKG